jgi:hypothetical protein
MRRRHRKTKQHGIKRWENAETLVIEAEEIAAMVGLSVKVNPMRVGRRGAFIQHVIFMDEGRQVLQWWSTRGT